MSKTFLSLALCGALAGFASAQVTLDDFETGVTGWTAVGYSEPSHVTSDGANSTAACMQIIDAGWGKGATKTFTAAAATAGNYKVTFYYKNGDQPAKNPWPGLGVYMNGANTVNLGDTVVATWTQAETGVAPLAASADVEIEVFGTSNAQADNECRFDEFVLESVASLPIVPHVAPPSGYFVAGTTTVTATAAGGSGTFTKAEFYIGATLKHTDSTPIDGLTWDFDTTAEVDGSVAIKVVLTDDAAATGEKNLTYTIDNARGRTANLITNGGFENWTAGLPDGWTQVNLTDTGLTGGTPPVITQETAAPFGGTSALKMDYAANPDPNRYTLLSTPFAADRYDYTTWLAAKGNSYVRVYYFQTTDGVLWLTTSQGASPSASSVWTEYVSAPYTPGAVRPLNLAVATHFYGSGTGYWDEIVVTATTSAVPEITYNKTWNLY